MKLYFYFLDKNGIREEEREVDEKPKTYKRTEDGFPRGVYGVSIKKSEIGNVISTFLEDATQFLPKEIEKKLVLLLRIFASRK